MHICRALVLYDYPAFTLTILKYINVEGVSKEEARKLIISSEQEFINSLSPEFNKSPTAGSRLGTKISAEAKIKIGKGQKRIIKSIEHKIKLSEAKLGENHPMFGRNHSTNTLLKMSIAKGTPIFVYNSDNTTLVYTFTSSKKASKFFNCSDHTIKRYFISGKLFKNQWILSTTLKSSPASS